ncbi:MAG: hypothetical protein JW795_22490, partial [Chitinivibrionales bacterium]|nr:hypothetical protein [Chitinivibrionales bacterium]
LQAPAMKLFLKGILSKENGLAIIADEKGKTYICKEGDKIEEQTVVKIERDKVLLATPKGTETLMVKEQ